MQILRVNPGRRDLSVKIVYKINRLIGPVKCFNGEKIFCHSGLNLLDHVTFEI